MIETGGRMECGFDHWDFSFQFVKRGVGWIAINKKWTVFLKLQKVMVRGGKWFCELCISCSWSPGWPSGRRPAQPSLPLYGWSAGLKWENNKCSLKVKHKTLIKDYFRRLHELACTSQRLLAGLCQWICLWENFTVMVRLNWSLTKPSPVWAAVGATFHWRPWADEFLGHSFDFWSDQGPCLPPRSHGSPCFEMTTGRVRIWVHTVPIREPIPRASLQARLGA